MNEASKNSSGSKAFLLVLIGQAISFLGTAITNFGVGVWVYEEAGNVSDFTIIAVAAVLPGVLFGPIAGTLVDRYRRKPILILGQMGSALCTLSMAVLYWFDSLDIWHILVLVIPSSICNSFIRPAFMASVPMLVKKEKLSKANGAINFAFGTIHLLAPAIAGVLIQYLGLGGVLGADLSSFIIGIFVLSFATIPSPEKTYEKHEKISILKEMKFAFNYAWNKPGLVPLVLIFALVAFNMAATQILITPLVLGFATKSQLGLVMSIGGSGIIVGGILMMSWNGPKRKVWGVLYPAMLMGVVLVFTPILPSIYGVAIGAFLVMVAFPIVWGCGETLLQRKTHVSVQGRLASFRNSVYGAMMPIAYLVAGRLADDVFEPLMETASSPWADSLGQIYGVGSGRGVAVMISIYGALTAIVVASAFLSRSMRRVDLDLPDYEVQHIK